MSTAWVKKQCKGKYRKGLPVTLTQLDFCGSLEYTVNGPAVISAGVFDRINKDISEHPEYGFP